jgi:hypothetical protein
MERETKKITTPSGKELVLKSYVTARERNEFRKVFFPHTEDGKHIDIAATDSGEAKAVEIVVVSYNGSEEKIHERLLDGSPAEYDAVVKEALEIVQGSANFPQAK